MIYDVNTLVPGDISRADWEQVAGAASSFLKVDPASIPITMADGTVIQTTFHLNSNQNAGNQASRAYYVAAPYAGTLVLAGIIAKPSWVGGTSAPGIFIADTSSAILASQVCTLTSTAQLFSVSFPVTIDTEYQVHVTCFDGRFGVTANSEALCSRFTAWVIPSGDPGAFWRQNLVRIPIDALNAQFSTYTTLQNRYCALSVGSQLRLRKSSAQAGTPISCVVEYYSTLADDQYSAPTLLTGDPGNRILDPWAQITPVTQNKVAFSAVTPWPSGPLDLVYSQPGGQGASGTFGRGVYVPASADISVVPPLTGRSLLVVGDSIMAGSTSPGSWNSARAFVPLIRRMYPGNVIFDAYGGRSFASDGYSATAGVLSSSGSDISLRTNMVNRVGMQAPSDLLVGLGTNSWTAGVSAVDMIVVCQAFAIDIMMRSPATKFFFLLPIFRTSGSAETTPNAGGATLPQLRTAMTTAISNAVTALNATFASGYATGVQATIIDGRTITDASDIGPDGIHPVAGTGGYYSSQKIVRAILNAFGNVFS